MLRPRRASYRRTSVKLSLAALAAVAFTTSGCAALRGAHTVGVDGKGEVAVTVLARRQRFDAAYLRFFPDSIRLRPGDAVRFEERGSGQPHAVAMGQLADAAARAIARLGEDPDPGAVAELPEVRALPRPFARAGPEAPVTLNRTAAEPCVVLREAAPALGTGGADAGCLRADLPEFNSDAQFYGSGLIGDGERFVVQLADSIPPGTYAFICLIAPEAMRGAIMVVPHGSGRPAPGSVRERGDDDQDRAARSLVSAAQLAVTATARSPVAGVPTSRGFDHLLTFGSGEYRIPTGGSLEWSVFGTHSITFGATAEARRGLTVPRDGGLALNSAAWEPKGPLVPVPQQAQVETAAGSPSTNALRLDGGSWGGTGMRSSGVLHSMPTRLLSYRLRFTRAGTYSYRCLVHPGMRGRVVVGGAEAP